MRAALVMNEFLAPRWRRFRDAQGQLAGITLLRSHGMHVQVRILLVILPGRRRIDGFSKQLRTWTG